MYCKERGKEILNPKAVICVDCGTKVGVGTNFCAECGKEISSDNQEVCLQCGCSLKPSMQQKVKDMAEEFTGGNEKSKTAAALLAIFLGGIGIHRYYLGYTGIGITLTILWVLGFFIGITWVITSIWALVDFILILCDKLKPINGHYK